MEQDENKKFESHGDGNEWNACKRGDRVSGRERERE